MIVAGLDFEATDKDPKTARITEIGAVLFEADGWKPVAEFSTLVWDSSYPLQSEEVLDVTGITDAMLEEKGKPPAVALRELVEFLAPAERIVAYNMEYDGVLYAHDRKRLLDPTLPELPRTRWLCAFQGVPWPEKYRCRKLSHLALDHGIHVDPSSLHRAVGDVLLMGQLLAHAGQTVEGMIAYAAVPWVFLQAKIPPPWEDKGVGVAAAKARGFGFEVARGTDAPRISKAWLKRVKQFDVEKEVSTATFPVVVLGE